MAQLRWTCIVSSLSPPFFLSSLGGILVVASRWSQYNRRSYQMKTHNQIETLKEKIHELRGQKVMLDRDLADLLGIETRRLNEQVNRNPQRFLNNVIFQLTKDEFEDWKSQFATSNSEKMGLRKMPNAFTKKGIEILNGIIKKTDQNNIVEKLLLAFDDVDGFNENKPENQLMTYVSEDGNVKFDVQYHNESVWLTQQQMADLFGTTQPNISLHLSNIFEEKEVSKKATHKESLYVQNEAGREVIRKVSYYNLDAIISVGYRVKSKIATHFRQWATKIIKGHITDGFTFKEKVTNDQLNQAKVYIDNRITVGDVHVHLKNRDIKLDFSQSNIEGLEPLVDRLIESVKNERPELEAHLSKIKTDKDWMRLLSELKEGSFFRSVLDSVSDARDVVAEIMRIAGF